MKTKKTIKGYKGFDKNMKCRGFQYRQSTSYTQEGEIRCCHNGFHFCENPLDVFGYYGPSNSHYCEVEGEGDFDRTDDKVAVSHIHIGAEIGLNGLIKAGVKFILDKVKWDDAKESNTGDRSAATNTGDCSAATNTGDCSAATNTGNRSAATNTGNRSAATNTGDRSAATNTGDWSAATNTGNCSAATNTGNRSAAEVGGKESIAIVTGKDSKAAGALGCWIVLTERGYCDGGTYPIKEVKAFKVDGDIIKPDVYYKLVDGNAVEAMED